MKCKYHVSEGKKQGDDELEKKTFFSGPPGGCFTLSRRHVVNGMWQHLTPLIRWQHILAKMAREWRYCRL